MLDGWGSKLDKLDDLDNLDNLDTTLLVSRWSVVCIGLVKRVMTQHHPYEHGGWRVMTHSMSSVLQRVMTQHHPYDEIRVAQVGWQRVTIWKNVCLLFWSRGANRFEGTGGR
jgi:hypothetical protein